jgi:hypothetical protein
VYKPLWKRNSTAMTLFTFLYVIALWRDAHGTDIIADANLLNNQLTKQVPCQANNNLKQPGICD